MNRRVLTVDEFCSAYAITRGFFYKLRAQGQGPDTLKLGRKTVVTEEAASAWLKATAARQLNAQGSVS